MLMCEDCSKRKIDMYDDVSVGNCENCGKIKDCINVTTSCHGSTSGGKNNA